MENSVKLSLTFLSFLSFFFISFLSFIFLFFAYPSFKQEKIFIFAGELALWYCLQKLLISNEVIDFRMTRNALEFNFFYFHSRISIAGFLNS